MLENYRRTSIVLWAIGGEWMLVGIDGSGIPLRLAGGGRPAANAARIGPHRPTNGY